MLVRVCIRVPSNDSDADTSEGPCSRLLFFSGVDCYRTKLSRICNTKEETDKVVVCTPLLHRSPFVCPNSNLKRECVSWTRRYTRKTSYLWDPTRAHVYIHYEDEARLHTNLVLMAEPYAYILEPQSLSLSLSIVTQSPKKSSFSVCMFVWNDSLDSHIHTKLIL